MKTHSLRLRAFPFTAELEEFFDRCDRVYVIEQNRDAQMASLIRMELPPARIAKLRSILHYTGIPIDARFVTDALVAAEAEPREDTRGR
jgi:2-oxoglutarate ferredoxin oxidoreductase subunit alpha